MGKSKTEKETEKPGNTGAGQGCETKTDEQQLGQEQTVC